MNPSNFRGKYNKPFNNSERGGRDHRNDTDNSQRYHQNTGNENSQRRFQNIRGRQFHRGKFQNNSRNHDEHSIGSSNEQKYTSEWNQNVQRSNIPSSVETQSAESQYPGATLDSRQNKTYNSVMQTDNNRHSTTEKVENYTYSNPVPMDSNVSNEVPREPSVEKMLPAVHSNNYKSIKVTGADENFDHVLKCLLDSHPERDKFLSELSNCTNVIIESAETPISAVSALSVNAPEFQMRIDQCFSSEPVISTSKLQEPHIHDTDIEQDPHTNSKNVEVLPQQSVSNQPAENTVSCDDEEEEGAVGGIKSDDAWDKKDATDWADEVEEKENVPTDTKQFVEKKYKTDEWKPDKWKQTKDQGKQQYKKVRETSGDLFTASEDHSLAHCVAVDMRMGSGIAVTFKRDFKNEGELLDQKKGVGQVAILEHKNRFIYYLVTKKYSNGKPRYEDLEKSLKEMKDHCVKNGVNKLAMPRIGCGLDRLEWSEVKPMIEEIFSDVDISITIYNLSSDKEDRNPLWPKVKLIYRLIPLVDIESETGLVFFGTEDGSMDECGQMLDRKFNFALDYRKEKKCVGTVLKFEKKKEYIYGLIIKKKESDSLSYVSLEKCLIELKKKTKKDKTFFIGFQAFCDGSDEMATEKFITLVRNVFFLSENEVHVCYPKNLEYLRQGDERGSESNKNSEETTGNRGQPAGERKGGYGNWNQQTSNRKKEPTNRNWRDD